MEKPLANRKIAVIIAFRDFQDQEYLAPKQMLEAAGANVTTASSSLGKAIGKFGGEADVNILLKDLKPADFDAVLFIGGPGAAGYIDDPIVQKIAKDAAASSKVLGAICIAPAILSKAGVLQGKKATVWSSPIDKSAVNILKGDGAIYQSENVVQDGKIITANGPEAAEEFALKIIEALK